MEEIGKIEAHKWSRVAYVKDNLVEAFMREEFLSLAKGANQPLDFLPIIHNYSSDMIIMETWKLHFRKLRIPYGITKRGGSFTLWKERIA